MSEISYFFKSFSLNLEYSDKLTEVIMEIICNCLEHSNSDCIIDIKLLNNKENKYKFISVTSLSFNDTFIGDELVKYINADNKMCYNKSNEIVMKAYNNHRSRFNTHYDLSSFALISSYQKYVTTRKNSEGFEELD